MNELELIRVHKEMGLPDELIKRLAVETKAYIKEQVEKNGI